jgi:hypothetical protein
MNIQKSTNPEQVGSKFTIIVKYILTGILSTKKVLFTP